MISLLNLFHPVLLSFIAGCAITFWLTRLLLLHSPDDVDFADFRRMKAGRYGLDAIPEDIHHESGWRQNRKGQLLFHQRFQKKNVEPRGVVLLCHGFGDHSAGYIGRLALTIAQLGFVVLSMDYAGHGRSDGLHALITSVDEIAEDVVDFALAALTNEPELIAKGIFLYGESMGGAVAFKICTAYADRCLIRGLVLMAPVRILRCTTIVLYVFLLTTCYFLNWLMLMI
jgi:pimeloyl-ACP methyl ester carboxylesterase